METNLMSGTIWKGSNAQITLPLTPKCFTYITAENIEINVYTEVSGASITYRETEMAISGNNATIVMQPVQLDALNDGIIRYNVAMDADGEHYVFDLETRWMLKTPNPYTPIEGRYILYVTHDYKDLYYRIKNAGTEERARIMGNIYIYSYPSKVVYSPVISYNVAGDNIYMQVIHKVGDNGYIGEYEIGADGVLKSNGRSKLLNQDNLTSAIDAETARTESTYLKEHQSLEGYATEQYVNNAMDAEIARTESRYVNINSLADFTTKQYVEDAISAETARTESTYQKVLTAGDGITIDENNVISSTGGDNIKVINFNLIKDDVNKVISFYEEIESLIPQSGVIYADLSHYRFFGAPAPSGYVPIEMYLTDYDRTEKHLKFSFVTTKVFGQRKILIADLRVSADGTYGWRIHIADLSSLIQ